MTEQMDANNIKANDLKRIERMIAENTDIIINGFKTPSDAREQEIMECIEKLGKEYQNESASCSP